MLSYQASSKATDTQLVWFDRAGKQIGRLGEPAQYGFVELSPDGKRVSVSVPDQAADERRDTWIYDVTRGVGTRFTFDPANDGPSIWSPDGSRIVFSSDRKGHFDLYQRASNASGSEELLFEDNLLKTPTSWSPDGKFILYTAGVNRGSELVSGTGSDLFILPFSGRRRPVPLLQTPFNEFGGKFSPDGRWVAYTSNESGRNEIYVIPFAGSGGKWRVSTAGGVCQRWRGDGKEIFYIGADNKLMAASVNGNRSTFEVGTVKPLFETRLGQPGCPYSVSPDGQQFLINTQMVVSAPITVVLNWTAGLNK